MELEDDEKCFWTSEGNWLWVTYNQTWGPNTDIFWYVRIQRVCFQYTQECNENKFLGFWLKMAYCIPLPCPDWIKWKYRNLKCPNSQWLWEYERDYQWTRDEKSFWKTKTGEGGKTDIVGLNDRTKHAFWGRWRIMKPKHSVLPWRELKTPSSWRRTVKNRLESGALKVCGWKSVSHHFPCGQNSGD